MRSSATLTASMASCRSVTSDPELGQAWRTLAKAYVRTKDKAAYEQLAKDYQAKFGTPLPP